jgi:hypothetical protein
MLFWSLSLATGFLAEHWCLRRCFGIGDRRKSEIVNKAEWSRCPARSRHFPRVVARRNRRGGPRFSEKLRIFVKLIDYQSLTSKQT